MRVLIVEDNIDASAILVQGLMSKNLYPSTSFDGKSAEHTLFVAHNDNEHFDAVVMDLMLPGMDGAEVVRSMRSRKDLTPVIVLSAKNAQADKIATFNAGADDFLCKPYDMDELAARIQSLIRRDRRWNLLNPSYGNLVYDLPSRTFSVEGKNLKIPPRALSFLECLFSTPGVARTKEKLQKLEDKVSSAAAMHIQVSTLRKILKQANANVYIRTFACHGYSLELISDTKD